MFRRSRFSAAPMGAPGFGKTGGRITAAQNATSPDGATPKFDDDEYFSSAPQLHDSGLDAQLNKEVFKNMWPTGESPTTSGGWHSHDDLKMLTRLRTVFGFYSSKPVKFVGSPASPLGNSHDVRYESLDFLYQPKHQNSIVSSSSPEQGRDEKEFMTAPHRLYRIHHIAGFISSLYVAEYRAVRSYKQERQGLATEDNTASRSFFLLDTGVPTDVTRIECALRHALGLRVDADESFDFISRQMRLVHAGHAHADHCGAATIWADRGCPVVMPQLMETHHGIEPYDAATKNAMKTDEGKRKRLGDFTFRERVGATVQYFVETVGANVYAWYLRRNFPEYTWFSPTEMFGHQNVMRIRGSQVVTVPPPPNVVALEKQRQEQNGDGTGSAGADDAASPTLRRGISSPDWIVLQIPGHTTHMTLLYHPSTMTVYVADLFLYQFGKFRPPIPLDRADCYFKSLELVRDLPVKWLLMPHGGCFELRLEGEKDDDDDDDVKKQLPPRIAETLVVVDTRKIKEGEYLKNLTEDRRRQETFREICDLVAERAKKQLDSSASSSSEKKSGKKSFDWQTQLVIKATRVLAQSSPAPARFDWEKDMITAEEQKRRVKKLLKLVKQQQAEEDEVPVGKHVYDYDQSSRFYDECF